MIGNGFLARNLIADLADRHDQVTAIAAGVSLASSRSVVDFDREAELLYRTIRKHGPAGRKIVFFSTANVGMYGADDSAGTEDGPLYPLTAYARHKLALESVLARAGVRWLTLRLVHLVGGGQPRHQLLPSLTSQVRAGRVDLYRGAHRDLLDVRHMICVLDRLLDLDVEGEVVNVASGLPEPVERIVQALESHLGVVAEKVPVEGLAHNGRVSIDRLRALVPEIDKFEFGPTYLPRLIERYVDAGFGAPDA